MAKNPGIVGTNPFKQPSVSRSDVSKNGYTLPIKGGIKVVNQYTKEQTRHGGSGGKKR